jgi:hypothetical protein
MPQRRQFGGKTAMELSLPNYGKPLALKQGMTKEI